MRDARAPLWFDDRSLGEVAIGGTDEHPVAYATALFAPAAYADLVRAYPGRILAVYIREVRLDPGDGRVEQVSAAWGADVPFVLAPDTDAMRAHAASLGLLGG